MKKLILILTVIFFLDNYQALAQSPYSRTVYNYSGPCGNVGGHEEAWVEGSQIAINMVVHQDYLAPSYYANNNPTNPMYAFCGNGYAQSDYRAMVSAWGGDDYNYNSLQISGAGHEELSYTAAGGQMYNFIVSAEYGYASIYATW